MINYTVVRKFLNQFCLHKKPLLSSITFSSLRYDVQDIIKKLSYQLAKTGNYDFAKKLGYDIFDTWRKVFRLDSGGVVCEACDEKYSEKSCVSTRLFSSWNTAPKTVHYCQACYRESSHMSRFPYSSITYCDNCQNNNLSVDTIFLNAKIKKLYKYCDVSQQAFLQNNLGKSVCIQCLKDNGFIVQNEDATKWLIGLKNFKESFVNCFCSTNKDAKVNEIKAWAKGDFVKNLLDTVQDIEPYTPSEKVKTITKEILYTKENYRDPYDLAKININSCLNDFEMKLFDYIGLDYIDDCGNGKVSVEDSDAVIEKTERKNGYEVLYVLPLYNKITEDTVYELLDEYLREGELYSSVTKSYLHPFLPRVKYNNMQEASEDMYFVGIELVLSNIDVDIEDVLSLTFNYVGEINTTEEKPEYINYSKLFQTHWVKKKA